MIGCCPHLRRHFEDGFYVCCDDCGGEADWVAIDRFSRYQINQEGEIRQIASGHLMSQHPNDGGYFQVKLLDDSGRRRWIRVHSTVLTTFSSPRPSTRHHCAHADRDKSNNRLDNLSWKLHAENESDKKRHGTAPKGTVPGARRLTPEEREGALRLLSTKSHSAVAKRYGVHRKTISTIAKKHGVESI